MLRGGPLVGSPARTSTFLGSVAALAGRWWLIAVGCSTSSIDSSLHQPNKLLHFDITKGVLNILTGLTV
jgi:hypothetical protein